MANQITLLHVHVPLNEPFRISSGTVETKESIIVAIERDGAMAFGEASPMGGAFYSGATPESTWEYLAEYAIGQWQNARTFRPEWAMGQARATPEQSFAWAGLEGALLDLEVQEKATTFCERLEIDPRPVESGLAVGITETLDELLEICRRYLGAGYKRLKLKIEPGWDVEPLHAARDTFGALPLMVDANQAYGDDHLEVFERLDRLGLVMIEQPLPKENLEGHRRLRERLQTPICLDEGADSLEAVAEALRRRACQIVNIKIQRVGGVLAARKMIEMCAREGIPTWMGTMPELGIGAVHATYLAMLPNCSFPTDVEASRRWFTTDIIDPPLEVANGMIELPEAHRRRPNVSMDIVDGLTHRAKSFKF